MPCLAGPCWRRQASLATTDRPCFRPGGDRRGYACEVWRPAIVLRTVQTRAIDLCNTAVAIEVSFRTVIQHLGQHAIQINHTQAE